MSLTLWIENMANLPDGGPLTYTLTGQRGADIGRDPHLDWTLPDPSRQISGTHCEIRYQDGGYWLRDVSANGTYLNGSDHRVQSPYCLKSGDQLTIGDYIVAVEVTAESVADPVSTAGPQPAFRDLWSVETVAPPMDPRDFRPPSDGKPVQPDFLEWAVDVPDAPGVGFVARPAPSQPPPSRADGWGSPPSTAPAVPKPRRSIWVSPAPSGPWGGGPAAPPDPPAGVTDPVATSPASSETRPAERMTDGPEAALSLQQGSLREPERSVPTRPAIAPRLAPSTNPAASDLLARFLKGANLPAQAAAAQDPGVLMERLGRVLLQVTTGLKQLLEARSQSKRLAGSSSHTMIAAVDNNPLKFSPTPADALRIMLGEQGNSYLDAEQAFRQSFDDLKTHQVKMMSAMQMALEKVVEDLDPKRIEEGLGEKTRLAAWSGLHGARLWTVYEQRWRAKQSRHGGGLHELFMEYFAECYDQITPGTPK